MVDESERAGARPVEPGRDAGFTLLETMMSLLVVGVVMSALTSFFVTTMSTLRQQGGLEVAAEVAADAMSRVRSMKGAELLRDRDDATSLAQWTSPAPGVAPYLIDMVRVPSSSPTDAGKTAPLPTVPVGVTVNGVTYFQHWYVGACWQARAGGGCGTPQPANAVAFYRVVVGVTWNEQRCAASTCSYVTSTLVSSSPGEPIFNLNEAARRPVVTNPGNQTGAVNSAVNLTLTATGTAPPLTWTFAGLPPGVTYNGGVLTGTLAATPQTYIVTASVRDSFNLVGTTSFTWTVTAEPPWAYYPLNEAPSSAASLVAADTSGNNRPGAYAGTTNGPSTWWPFDETTGTVANDASGAVNPGTLTNTPARVAGTSGSALSFNGTSSSVQGTRSGVRTDRDFTVSAWAYLDATGTANRAVVSQNGSTTYGFALRYFGASNRWAFAMPNSDGTNPGVTQATSSAAVTPATWVHLTGVYRSSSNAMALYVNGAASGTNTRTSHWHAPGRLQAGAELYNGVQSDFFNGRVDDVRVYQRALSATEVAGQAAGRPALQWDFSEGTGSTTADLSGSGNTGTFGAGAAWATTGHFGRGVELTGGSSDNFVAAATPAVRTDTSFTVSAWAYLPYGFGDGAIVSQAGTNASGFVLKYDRSDKTWQFTMPRSDSNYTLSDRVDSLAEANTDVWTHVVGVYDAAAGTVRLYVNGTSQGTDTHAAGDTWNAVGRTEVGRAKSGGDFGDSFYGRVDSVRLYPRALTAAEVTDLADDSAPAPGVQKQADMTAGLPGALPGSATAVAFAGTSNGHGNTPMAPPAAFTSEVWFRAAGTRGGVLIGFYERRTGGGGARDRQVYLDNGGRLTFGVYPSSSPITVRSPAAYNDGAWHHVVTSAGPAGMKLYVDGALVASNATQTTAGGQTGYWRWGGGDTGLWPNRPASDYLVGTLDEVGVHRKQLTDAEVTERYQANR